MRAMSPLAEAEHLSVTKIFEAAGHLPPFSDRYTRVQALVSDESYLSQ